jgi:ribosome-binding protein aMBF1 (putative translation factor)
MEGFRTVTPHRKGVNFTVFPTPFNWPALVDQAMKTRGWNQTDLAEALGMDKSNITYYLGGKIPSDETLRKMQEIVQFDLNHAIVAREFERTAKRLRRRGIDPSQYLN